MKIPDRAIKTKIPIPKNTVVLIAPVPVLTRLDLLFAEMVAKATSSVLERHPTMPVLRHHPGSRRNTWVSSHADYLHERSSVCSIRCT